MAQTVRVDVPRQPGATGVAPDHFPDHLPGPWLATRTVKHPLAAGCTHGGRLSRQVGLEVTHRNLTDGHQSPLPPFAVSSEHSPAQVDITELELDELRDPQPR
jgi:hypothetical protein